MTDSPDDDRAAVLDAFRSLAKRAGFVGDAPHLFRPVLSAYSEPLRHYHNVRHIAQCLRELGTAAGACGDLDAVTAAILFHDAVYDPTRHDNEERSADVADAVLRTAGFPDERRRAVRRLILATKHAAAPAAGDEQLVVDIDLSILGKPREEFDAYERAIRQEYAHVPDSDFADGRTKVLQSFLNRKAIYCTATFGARYEAAARENLRRSVERLAAGEAGGVAV